MCAADTVLETRVASADIRFKTFPLSALLVDSPDFSSGLVFGPCLLPVDPEMSFLFRALS